MIKEHPSVYIVAGPNGAGKTTFAVKFLPQIAMFHFVNADMIASGLSPLKPDVAALDASRVFLDRIREMAVRRNDFAFETTLSGKTYVKLFRDMREMGYRIYILFLWLPSAELAILRVAGRVRKGGHNVPADDIRRRFGRGLQNPFGVYKKLCDELVIFDNSSHTPRLVAVLSKAEEIILDSDTYNSICQQGGQ